MLIAFDVSLELVRLVRRLLPALARRDRDLASQLRRAVNSVALNIAEGDGRWGQDQTRVFRIAHGSAKEVHAALLVCQNWQYLSAEELAPALALSDRLSRLLSGLTR